MMDEESKKEGSGWTQEKKEGQQHLEKWKKWP